MAVYYCWDCWQGSAYKVPPTNKTPCPLCGGCMVSDSGGVQVQITIEEIDQMEGVNA